MSGWEAMQQSAPDPFFAKERVPRTRFLIVATVEFPSDGVPISLDLVPAARKALAEGGFFVVRVDAEPITDEMPRD